MQLTFTGVDERTNLSRLAEIAFKFPYVEFAVLVGSRTGRSNRFPKLAFVRDVQIAGNTLGFRKAIHLCGKPSRDVNKGEFFLPESFAFGFNRVQVNAVNYNPEKVAMFQERLQKEVICQYRGQRKVGEHCIPSRSVWWSWD